MVAVAVLVHLNRFALWDALNLGRPRDLDEERNFAKIALAIVTDSVRSDDQWKYR